MLATFELMKRSNVHLAFILAEKIRLYGTLEYLQKAKDVFYNKVL